MIDEQLIAEVEQHGVIYNRQKYCINMGGAGGVNNSSNGVNKYETKDEAWQIIAMKLRSDVETCKKRWKYLRERYVSQRKQGDPPVYEHLSRPYLEKMKFLDQHIQPRKSYRNVSNFLTSPNANSSFCEYNMDSSKSNGSIKNHSYLPHHQQQQQSQSAAYSQDNVIKTEEDQTFRDFAAAVTAQHLQQINSHHPPFNSTQLGVLNSGNHNGNTIGKQPTLDNYDQYRENDQQVATNANVSNVGNGVASSTSSSMKSPMSSSPPPPPPAVNNNNASPEIGSDHQFLTNGGGGGNSMKKPRVQMTTQFLDTSDSDDNTSPASTMRYSAMLNNKHAIHMRQSHDNQQQQQQLLQQHQQKQQHQYNKMLSNATHNLNTMNHTPPSTNLFPTNNDFLFSLYQQMTPAAAAAAIQQDRNITNASANASRSSEHLLGELVTSELLKMNKDRRKTVQKRILEILFFED